METIQKTIEIELPVSTVYNQWTQFEEFPKFMEGITSVKQLSDKHLHWTASIAGKQVEWDAEIYEQRPDETIAWRSIDGTMNVGSVHFIPLQNNRTLIELKITFKPETIAENIGDAFGLIEKRIQGDLERFKKFIENRSKETGGWRGEIHTTSSVNVH
jgi:uncharacterized membrane protein